MCPDSTSLEFFLKGQELPTIVYLSSFYHRSSALVSRGHFLFGGKVLLDNQDRRD